MPAALSEQLADELGCSVDDADRMLHDILEEIERRAQDGEDVSIPGLGTFSTDEGTLQFTPGPALQQAVNYRNSHLQPLAVSESSSPPPDQEEPSASTAAVSDAPPDDVAPPEPETAAGATEPDVPPAEKAPAAAEPVDENASETVPETEEVPDLSADWTEELDTEEEDTPTRRSSGARGSSGRPSTGQLVGLVVSIVLLIGLIGFVLSSQGLLPGSSSPRDAAPAATPTDTAAADTAVTVTSADTTRSSSDASSDPAPGETTGPPSTPATIDRATGGWSIVVASRTRPGQAKAALSTYRQRFQGEGIPVDILTGESNGELRYRVAVGQYPSQEAAQTALQQLQGRIPDDAWTLQIQSDS